MSPDTLVLLRYAVLAVAAVAVLGAFAAMAVQSRAINPFGWTARSIRRLTDPLLAPIERRIVRAGGNPQSAPWWLIGIAVAGGIVVIQAVEWLVAQALTIAAAASFGPSSLLRLVVDWAFNIVMIALVVRIVGSWIGATPHTRWMRPFVVLTEWMLAPLRRVVPPFGMFDLTPLVAWILLQLARGYVLGAL
ncbi:MAG: YggT family protein [Gemmatimonadales bacterium]